jgi:hypothetical protein
MTVKKIGMIKEKGKRRGGSETVKTGRKRH